MYKCHEDSSDQDQQDQVSLERGLVLESIIEVDHLICSICHHIVWHPVTCGSQKGCQNAFCSFCIDSWLKRCQSQELGQPLCPQCKRPFVKSRVPPIIQSVLEGLRLKCPNTGDGCKEVLRYGQIIQHVRVCQFKMRTCRGCRRQILSREYESHTSQCPKYIIKCHFCGADMSKVQYLGQHIKNDIGLNPERSFNCYQNQINRISAKVNDLSQNIEEVNSKCDRLQNLTKAIVVGEPLDLVITYYTTFTTNFSFPHPTLIKPSFNQQKDKFDFLHFYVLSPIYTDSFASVKWAIRVNKMAGNILLGFCSNMSINSLDYIVNKYGELKRKDVHDSKYKIVRKNDFSFSQGDIIRCRYLSLRKAIKLENETKKQQLHLGCSEVQQFAEGARIFVFISMDTANDSISFI